MICINIYDLYKYIYDLYKYIYDLYINIYSIAPKPVSGQSHILTLFHSCDLILPVFPCLLNMPLPHKYDFHLWHPCNILGIYRGPCRWPLVEKC